MRMLPKLQDSASPFQRGDNLACACAHNHAHIMIHDAQNLTETGTQERAPSDGRLYKSLESARGSPGVPSAHCSARSAYSTGSWSAGTQHQSRDGVRRRDRTGSSHASAWEPTSQPSRHATNPAPAPAPREASVVAFNGSLTSLTQSMGSVASVGSRGSNVEATLNGMAFYKDLAQRAVEDVERFSTQLQHEKQLADQLRLHYRCVCVCNTRSYIYM